MASPLPPSGSPQTLTAPTRALLTHFLALLSTTQSSQPTSASAVSALASAGETAYDPYLPVLSVLKDAASLLRAHTTKLSLLAINKPFTPSAIEKVLKEIQGTCLPAMMGAVEACTVERWGACVRGEVVGNVGRALRARNKEILATASEKGQNGEEQRNKEVLATTGLVWEACDALVGLQKLGVVGLVIQKAENYRGALADALDELKEWGEDEEDEDEEENDDGFSEDGFGMEAENKMPKGDSRLRELLDESLKKIRLVETLFKAISKRRLKSVPTPDCPTQKLDKLMGLLKKIPDDVDDLANAFYQLDSNQAEALLRGCVKDAKAVSEVVSVDWKGERDAFTEWAGKWREIIDVPSAQ
ncbi:hypothetical protein K402DRAFT_375751 [Aulographum hederae CBS 113979]|uniref:Cyclin-D1-binding protein 1-like N-terminal domain-containing protein n=1 Tax=Aulographum hederae CBS 113979 TaxID=1176131 RepID=A0A6G1H1R1_9PEZI|nr:hypothetical protein K402DRAFT_375751 [Aulographum hederae CBS 113979]